MFPTNFSQFLKQAHPVVQEQVNTWQFLEISKRGGKAWIDRYLYRHEPRETQEDFKQRQKRAVYPNYVRAVLKTYRNHVFKRGEAIRRELSDDTFAGFQKNVDRRGRNANAFWGNVGMDTQLYGWCGVLIDKPASPVEASRAAEREGNVTPYYVHYPPTSVRNWRVDEDGELLMLHLVERTYGGGVWDTPKPTLRHRIWTREQWGVFDDKGAPLASGENRLGAIPFVVVRFEESDCDDWIGSSFMEDFAVMNRAVANSVSLRDGFIAKNALQILTLHLDPMANDPDGGLQEQIRNILEYTGDKPPAFIGPDIAGAEWMFRHEESLLERMYQMAMLQQELSRPERRSETTATGRMIDFEQTNSALTGFADALEEGEVEAAKWWHRWEGGDYDATGNRIDYPDSFNVRSLAEELETALLARDLYGALSPTLVARSLLKLARRLDEDLSPEDAARVEAELAENADSLTAESVIAGREARERDRNLKS